MVADTLSSNVPPFTIIPDEVIKNCNLNPFAGWLYTIISSFAYKGNDTAFPSIATLAALAGMGESSVKKYLGILREKGLLKIERREHATGDNDTNLYTIIDPSGVRPAKKILTIAEATALWEQREEAKRDREIKRAAERRKQGVAAAPSADPEPTPLPVWSAGYWKTVRTIALTHAAYHIAFDLQKQELTGRPDELKPDSAAQTLPDATPTVSEASEPPPKIDRFKSAIAVAFRWKTPDGNPDLNHAMMGSIITQLLGTAKRGLRKDFAIGGFDDPDKIVGLKCWYVTDVMNKEKLELPSSADALYKRAKEFEALPVHQKQKWIEKGERHLNQALGIEGTSEMDELQPPIKFNEEDLPAEEIGRLMDEVRRKQTEERRHAG